VRRVKRLKQSSNMHLLPDSKFEKAETALRFARPSKINSSAA
jgi:hypothetical protein